MLVSDLSPREVYSYFKEISDIPRGSGNTEKIADYCEEFAKKHSLKVIRDESDNIIIFKDGSSGYENHEPVILQGHLDMVCEKEQDCDIDMDNEGVRLRTDGKKIWADGTTLGADDGIAIAYMLAVLSSDTIQHPPIEAVFTTGEEIGMLGARALDTSVLKSKRLINIDSETEGELFVSCAGGVRAKCDVPVEYTYIKYDMESPVIYEISISGLAGGHSGVEIHKQNTNAIRLMGSVLAQVQRRCDIRIVDVSGGGKENAVPKESKAYICMNGSDAQLFCDIIHEYESVIKKDLENTEPDVKITAHEDFDLPEKCLTLESTRKVIFVLQMSPDGVYKMNQQIEGMVQTSLNLGTAYIQDDTLIYKYLIRSNTATGKQLLLERVTEFTEFISGEITTMSDYPAWEYKHDSKLQDIMIKSFVNVYGYEPKVTAVHAGLECGILSGSMTDTDMISFGPTLTDVHTPNECMDAESAERTWKYLLEVLKNM